MKRIKNLTLAIAILFAAMTTYANSYPTINLDADKTLLVDLNDWTITDVSIIIKDERSEILHTDAIVAGTAKNRRYNLKNLPIGNYQLVIDGFTKTAIHTINVGYDKVNIETESSKIVFKPMFAFEDNAVELNHLALGKKVSISISDKDGVFFNKVYEGIPTINKRFDISDLPSGSYVISLETEEQYVAEAFNK